MSRAWRSRILAAAVVVLVVIGVVLVVTGGDDEQTAPSTTTTTTAAGATPVVTLPLDDTSQAAVATLARLAIPASATDFLTTFPEARTQLDVTFTIPAAEVEAFVSGSGFPALSTSDRVITHSSPLWKVNPEGKVSGASDRTGDVVRAVETVPEDGRVRVRLVVSPAS